jgi:hypothetical protein
MSPKFECCARNDETYRVKYGVNAHTTVAASRLLWALVRFWRCYLNAR